jgi:hypothetical protein
VAAAALAVGAVSAAATRRLTASGLAGTATAPVAALALGERRTALSATVTAMVIAAAHARGRRS